MGVDGINSVVDIAVSGLRAQSMKMNVVASNIANASTRGPKASHPIPAKRILLSKYVKIAPYCKPYFSFVIITEIL